MTQKRKKAQTSRTDTPYETLRARLVAASNRSTVAPCWVPKKKHSNDRVPRVSVIISGKPVIKSFTQVAYFLHTGVWSNVQNVLRTTCGRKNCINPRHVAVKRVASQNTEVVDRRFWNNVTRVHDENGCWLWKGALSRDGYARFSCPSSLSRSGKTENLNAHRMVFFLIHGFWPPYPRFLLRHDCDNPRCVRPSHIRLGTHLDNTRDMVKRDRSLYGERNSKAKLTWGNVRKIRLLSGQGDTYKELAALYGVSEKSISNVMREATWSRDGRVDRAFLQIQGAK